MAALLPIAVRSPIFMCAIPPLLACKGFVRGPGCSPHGRGFFSTTAHATVDCTFGGCGYDSRNRKTDCKKSTRPEAGPHGKPDRTETMMTNSAGKMAPVTLAVLAALRGGTAATARTETEPDRVIRI